MAASPQLLDRVATPASPMADLWVMLVEHLTHAVSHPRASAPASPRTDVPPAPTCSPHRRARVGSTPC